MHKNMSYRILNIGLKVGLGLIACMGVAQAQYIPTAPTQESLYCSGVVTTQQVPRDTYLISGENARYKTTFAPGDSVYINQGAEHGVKVGDQFEVIREKSDSSEIKWFKYQYALTRAMGTTYADIGLLRIVHVDAKTSIAEMTMPCDFMQRGDIVRPYEVRPAPQFHDAKLDSFAAPSGKKTAMVVTTKDFGTMVGAGRIFYANLGSGQGVQVGNYFRVFRYYGASVDTIQDFKQTSFGMYGTMYGFGSTPGPYDWKNLPRHILGEGIVLRTGPNSSTVLLTTSRQEVFVGDYLELE
jgi:hypothetical protein